MKSFINLSLVALLLLTGCGKEKPAAAPASRTRNVQVAAVQGGGAQQVLRATGTVVPADEVKLAFKIGGILAQASVKEGDAVKVGQVLARLNTVEIDANVAQAQIALAKAERDYARAERLQQDSVVTLAQLQDARSGLDAAREQLRIAQFNRQYSIVTAPVSGRILRQLAQPGELISPGAPVYLLGATGKGWVVRAGLSDREVVQVRVGDKASIRLSAFPGVTYEARITEIGAILDATTGSYPVELVITPKPGQTFVAGIVAQADIEPRVADKALRIPVEALLQADGENGVVYMLGADGKTVKRQPVKVATLRGTEVVLTEGPAPGTQVVTAGAAYLRDGDTVTVVNEKLTTNR